MNLKMSSAKWRPLCLRLNVLILYFITKQVNHHENSTNKWQDSPYITFKGRFKNTYKLLNLGALTFSPVNKIHIFQCMGEIFCVEFQRYPFKFHKNIFTMHWNIWFFTQNAFLNTPQHPPPPPPPPDPTWNIDLRVWRRNTIFVSRRRADSHFIALCGWRHSRLRRKNSSKSLNIDHAHVNIRDQSYQEI